MAKKRIAARAGKPEAVPPPRWERLRWIAVCAASGVLWFLACADIDIWPLAWVAMVPTLFAVERAQRINGAEFG